MTAIQVDLRGALKRVPTYYLAHPYEARHDMRAIELRLELMFPIKLINPFYDQEWRRSWMEKLDACKSLEEEKELINTQTDDIQDEIVQADTALISDMNTDGIIAYIPSRQSGGGLWCELQIACDKHKHIVIVTTEMRYHVWLKFFVRQTNGFFAKSLSDAVMRICERWKEWGEL